MNDHSSGPRRSLLPAERRERLLALLEDGHTHRVDDLAVALGVTTVTVRRDLTQLTDERLVDRVRGGVRRLASRHDPTATDPMAGSFRIGMVVPTMRHLYWPEVVRGARAAAARHGATLVLRGSTYVMSEYRRDVMTLLETGEVDGLVVAPSSGGPEDPDLGSWFRGLGVPVVLAERQLTAGPYREPLESVSTDHALGAATAVRHFARLGHRRVGLLMTESVTAVHLRAGWREACTELAMPLEGTPVATIPRDDGASWTATADSMIEAARASNTTALLVHPDDDAISFLDRCADRGVRIPADLSVITYNDEIANLATPALTAVSPPKTVLGGLAVETLLSRLAPGGDALPVRRTVLSPVLIERDSTGPRPGNVPAAAREAAARA